jgi:2-polyprenyl-6-methoxyphenol hydroxylase-like FAD-dependent oxidoreductase
MSDKGEPNRFGVDESKALDAVVIGGSMAGLCAGLVLCDAGCAVEIFEKSPCEMQERGAGLVVQDEVLNFVMNHCRAIVDELGVPSRARQLVARDGSVIWTETSPPVDDFLGLSLPPTQARLSSSAVPLWNSARGNPAGNGPGVRRP